MKGGHLVKMLGLAAGVAVINVIALSPGLLGLRIQGGTPLEAAIAVTLIAVSLMAVFYGCYVWVLRPPAPLPVKEARTHEDFVDALIYYRDHKVLKKDIRLAIDQLERMHRRKSLLIQSLGERFERTEISYQRFANVIGDVDQLFYANVRGILGKLTVFDPSELAGLEQRLARLPGRLAQQKKELFDQYVGDIAAYIGTNEEILLKLDRLQLEMARLGGAYGLNVEDMSGIKELNALIVQTKHYRE